MVFSSDVFLFLFLPAVLFFYYVVCRKSIRAKNIILLLSSLFFYAWGEPAVVFLMILSIVVNYFFGLHMDGKHRKGILIISVLFNLSFLFVFKYLDFALETAGFLLGRKLAGVGIALPIGISFYTFQSLSYVVDVYRGKVAPQRNLMNLGLYVALFPQLIAGPIVRYSTIEQQILGRRESLQTFSSGVERFIIGLAKKMLIANNVGFLADTIYGLQPAQLNTAFLWLAAIAYTLQIYYDFSGYSDMAIGLGKLFGFTFEENFNYPYIANSVTDFWRRWHISLSGWFRDYVYIPLGGNRVRKGRHIFNLFVTWLCTGLWHGANWTFVVWGLYFFVFLILEKHWKTDKVPGLLSHVYTMLVVVISWVIFRAQDLSSALYYLGEMFRFELGSFAGADFLWYLKNFAAILALGIFFTMPVGRKLNQWLEQKDLIWLRHILLMLLLLLCVSFMFRSSYNPFIYFNF